MSHPTLWEKKCQLYALGNTPAVNLLQDLAPEEDANVLLLGCGDPRSILASVYNRLSAVEGSKVFDVTCCDLEPAVLARNVLLFTLIYDGQPIDDTWQIFYHLKISPNALSLLSSQCENLIQHSSELSTWYKAPYSHFLRVCSAHTLAELRRFWQLYADTCTFSSQQLKELNLDSIKPPEILSSFSTDFNNVISRSTGDFTIFAADSLGGNFAHYWKHGVVDEDPGYISKATKVNPTFCYGRYGTLGDHVELFWGTYPLAGFHLSEVFTSGAEKHPARDFVDCARKQFKRWYNAFQDATSVDRPSVMIRLFVGDALSFCRTLLKCRETSGSSLSASLPNSAYSNIELVLDGGDYSRSFNPSTAAPTSFNIIDTSNVVDHIGFLNIMIATIPLLSPSSSSSTLYTEMLCGPRGDTFSDLIRHLCTPDIPTFALLFGVAPVSYISQFTPRVQADELLSVRLGKPLESYHERVAWKSVSSLDQGRNPIKLKPHFETTTLARLMLDVMVNMFPTEQIGIIHDQFPITYSDTIHYTRSNFALLLAFIRKQGKVKVIDSWELFVRQFLELVMKDRTLVRQKECYQDLCVQLHLHGVGASTIELTPEFKRTVPVNTTTGPFRGWSPSSIPGIVCCVLIVPREKLRILEEKDPKTILNPMLQVIFKVAKDTTRRFSDAHCVFGDVTVDGHGEDTRVIINQASDPWRGEGTKQPLVVSFLVGTRAFWGVDDLKGVTVGLQMHMTSLVVREFPELNPHFTLFEAGLTDRERVLFVKERPLTRSPDASSVKGSNGGITANQDAAVSEKDDLCATIELDTDLQISEMRCRVSLTNENEKKVLAGGAQVRMTQAGVTVLKLDFAGYEKSLAFPFPFDYEKMKLRIARKSGYIEVLAQVLRPTTSNSCTLHSFSPVPSSKGFPIPWNTHRVNLSKSPTFTRRRSDHDWMNGHTSSSFSTRERNLFAEDPKTATVLVKLKHTIHSLFVLAMEDLNHRVFYVNRERDAGEYDPYCVIFLNEMRLDLANYDLVADCCVLPLTQEVEKKFGKKVLEGLGNVRNELDCTEEEIEGWKQLLPTFVERCRTWDHKDTCEYLGGTNQPSSSTSATEWRKYAMCSCGKGLDLGGFEKRALGGSIQANRLAPFVTRAAISQLFTVPFLESVFTAVKKPSRPGYSSIRYVSEGAVGGGILKKCKKCGRDGKQELLVCSRCRVVAYCGEVCQRGDWKEHKKVCVDSKAN